MKEFNIYINCVLEVLDDSGKSYKSRVQEVGDEYVNIDIHMENGEYILSHKGDEIAAILYHEKNGMLYKLKFKVIDRIVDGKLRLYKLSEPYAIEKIQRRDYVRVNTTMIVKYKTKEMEMYLDGVILDLSGGGMRVKVDKKLELGEKVEFIVNLNGKFAKIDGETKRITKDLNDKKYVSGFEFIDINETVRDRIIQIVFSIMRKQIEVL